jgi:type II secretory ATPase GspE/PulE/Tfp pilus assembly ATPase PilB-like protein
MLEPTWPYTGHAGDDTHALLLAMLKDAERKNVSDIHIDPSSRGYDIRFRIDGVLQDIGTLDAGRGLHLLRSFKSQAGLDPGFEMTPQSGRAEFSHEGMTASVRVATAPGVRGEKMTLRLLSEERERVPLHELGLSDKDHAELLTQIADVRGMILVSGPTGSGKTTTLYALMRELRQTGRSIMTIEDPVEFVMEDITQIQLNEKQGLDFSEGVRSLLRLDPDIIVMGEMRDASSARAALHAADTGHVCLSTLHARDAAGTITVLRNFGCLDHEIASSVDLIISQRLVRRLCTRCRKQEPPAPAEAEFIVLLGQPVPSLVWHAGGCAECDGTGHKGRIGIFEIHRIHDDDADLFLGHANERAIRAHMRRRGARSLVDQVLHYVEDGVTSLEEMLGGLGLGFFSHGRERVA